MGFKHKRVDDKRHYYEQPRIVEQRHTYLRRMRRNRQEKRPVVHGLRGMKSPVELLAAWEGLLGRARVWLFLGQEERMVGFPILLLSSVPRRTQGIIMTKWQLIILRSGLRRSYFRISLLSAWSSWIMCRIIHVAVSPSQFKVGQNPWWKSGFRLGKFNALKAELYRIIQRLKPTPRYVIDMAASAGKYTKRNNYSWFCVFV